MKMGTLVIATVLLAGCGGAAEPTDPNIEISTAPSTPAATVPEQIPTTPDDGSGDATTFGASIDDVDLEIDVSGQHDMARRADALRAAVDAPEVTFLVGRVDNRGDAPVTMESVEITTDAGDVITFTSAAEVVRELRSAVELYDTETYQRATELLDAVEAQVAAAPGSTSERLFVAAETLPSISQVVAVGSFGRQQLSPREQLSRR